MFKVAERLMKERKNQGFSIKAMAEKGGVTENTQQFYEYGSLEPEILYFKNLDANGIDVLYILTGCRTLTENCLDDPRGFLTIISDTFKADNGEQKLFI